MSAGEVAAVAAVLAEHTMVTGFDEIGDYHAYACDCSFSGKSDGDFHAHVAAALLASDALAGLLREARAEALRDAANTWTRGAWSDVMLPKPTPPAVPVIDYSNRVGEWLRDRADQEAK